MAPLESKSTLVFFVNGKKVVESNLDPKWTLLHYLRDKQNLSLSDTVRLCGTKLGCGEGGCGACTVMVSRYDRVNDQVIHIPINACLAPICSLHGLAVTTIEGIGSTKTKLHPVQERIAKAHGSQCGFCTPGIVMSMYTLLRNSPKPSMKDMEVAFQGNLCRCTGYRPIIEGYKTFTEEWELIQNGNKINGEAKCGMGDKCCKLQNGLETKEEEVLFQTSEFTPYDATQEPIFPPELKISDKYDKAFLVIKGKTVTWYRPTRLVELLELKKQHPDAKIVVGNTEVGVEVKFKRVAYPVVIHPSLISELVEITCTDKGVKVGASTTLWNLEQYLKKEIKRLPECKTRVFQGVVNMLNVFGGKQIRSVGAIGSNIMTGSPISDIIPILMANKVTLELQSKDNGIRKVSLDNDFFVGYRKCVVKPDEILLAIHFPYTHQDQYFYTYKQARRREDDIAIVNAAINVTFQPKSHIIAEINLAFGGMSFKTVMAPKTQEKLKGLPWNRNTLETAYTYLLDDLPLDPSAPGGMILYRKSLTLSLFFKAFLTISTKLQKYLPNIAIDEKELSGVKNFTTKTFKSSQYFNVVPETQEKTDTVHRPLIHMSAYKQATGEALYCDDIPKFENELFLVFVISTESHANIVNIDPSEALAVDGVEAFIGANDVEEERNTFGVLVADEKVYYNEKVTSQGQIIGAIAASDREIARKAARKVKINYENLQPVIVTIEDAIKNNSYFHNPFRVLVKGDIDKLLEEAPHVIEGCYEIGGQEQFYMETHGVVVVPKKEDDEIEVFSSTQCPAMVTANVARVLGIAQNKVVTRVKRLGGGFGGKETRSVQIALPVAVAAKKLQRPIRCILDRDEDMVITGGRHPFLIKFKAAFDDNGKILGVDFHLYNNCGYSVDFSPLVLERAMTHCENAYYIPVIRVTGYCCKTNLPSNSAMRGFGGPQAMFATENIINDIATYLKKNVVELTHLNLYREGDITYYNQKLINCTMRKVWSECLLSSNYHLRRKEVDDYNKKNKYKKRGISVIPTKYGIGFSVQFLNQGGALILVYTDGSVLLTHGGVEMGQGLHTKMIQVASRCLEIPMEKIHTSEVATDKVPNATSTAASLSSDLNGMAVLEACNVIKERLRPYKEANPAGKWEDWVLKAYFDRVSLSATGFYKIPEIGYNWETGEGMLHDYFTFGAACCETEIDTLTGDHQVLRIDIVMDLGESLNPAIDVGQIEGGFMQGYGLFVLEELIYSPNGTSRTKGPGTYKLPGFADIPQEMNVSLLKGSSNPRAVYSSKAIGEPPLFLGSSVFFAIKDAIKAFRQENGASTAFVLNSPATAEKIRMACQDNITSRQLPDSKTFQPWNVTGV